MFMQLFHLSESNHDGEIFIPKSLPKWRAMEGENWRRKRICMSATVDGALTALLSSDSQPFGKHMFVHVPDQLDEIIARGKVFKPSTDLIPDAEATGEMWIKCPARMLCIGELEVMGLDPDADLECMHRGHPVKLDKFTWKWIWQKRHA